MHEFLIMEYKEYLNKARKSFGAGTTTPDEFYEKGTHPIDKTKLTSEYMLNVESLAEKLKAYFDSKPQTGMAIQYKDNIFDFPEIGNIANEIVPILEEDLYGCNLYVDKAYMWRSLPFPKRDISWLWHYDNNPNEIYKVMIYLTDVEDDSAPFEYVEKNGKGFVIQGTRQGPKNWSMPSDKGRVSPDKIVFHKQIRVSGKQGNIVVFNNNVVHRANSPEKGKHRDVLVIRMKPTINPVDNYFDKKHTTSYESSGVVNKNPEII